MAQRHGLRKLRRAAMGRWVAALAIGMAATLANCAALAHDTLRVLAWPGYADRDIVRTFEQHFDVSVQVTIVDSDEDLWARVNARQGGPYDVFAVNTAELARYIDAGLVAPLDFALIPNIAGQQARFRDRKAIPGIARGDAVYAVPYTYSAMGLIYDRTQVKDAPDSIAALWDPRYQGRVLAFDTGGHNFSIAALALGLPDPFHIDESDTQKVVDKLIALRRNVLGFYSLPEESVELFRSRHAAILFANYGTQQVQQLRQAGADIGYVIPREGALAWLDCWTMTHASTHKALAQAWINYMLEPQVGRELTARQGLANTVDAAAPEQQGGKILWLQPVENAARRSTLWAQIVSGDRAVSARPAAQTSP